MVAAAGCAVIVGGHVPALAQEASLSSLGAVDSSLLAEQRAGSLTVSGNEGQVLVAQSLQTLSQSSTNPTLIADSADGGDIFIGDEALSNARGMINVNVNSGHNALVQGVMSLTMVLTEAQ